MTTREIFNLTQLKPMDRDVFLSIWESKSTPNEKYDTFRKADRLQKYLFKRTNYNLKFWDQFTYIKFRLI